MNRKSFTAILVGGALAGGCSKPNPLFLDTWDVITDSGSVSQTSAVTLETTTIEPPTTTSDPPVTTTSTSTSPSTITSSSDNTTTTTEPNPTTETTNEGFVCDGVGVDMEGCCEVKVTVEADTFLSDAFDGVNGECKVSGEPVPFDCKDLSFGEVESGSLLKDNGMVVSAIVGITMMALRFPTKDGQLDSDHGPVPTAQIESVQLVLKGEDEANLYGEPMQFSLHALDADQGWSEGGKASQCADGLSSFACRVCGAVGECTTPWTQEQQQKPLLEVLQPLGVVDAICGDSGLQPIDLASLGSPEEWVPAIVAGSLVVAPKSATFMNEKYEELIPAPGIKVHARESGAAPRLVVRVCQR
ncbi:hypothetical protein OV079_25935 [Nannocystis pusilla]|uniref:Uncharacterized protein n=1 Tax=Nannocystis pusilla TaxID=889268 RepID=A0A9X3IZC9_9BACT|nr:hypothetical protein [Nannocystis pusilla]MCY1008935.1 hypothetical protein [Nannocystis pusilla]